MARRRKFGPECKARVVLEVLTDDKTGAEVCREHRISSQQLRNWKKQFMDHAPVVFENGKRKSEEEQQIAELERMVGKLTMQLEIVKKPQTSCARTEQETGDSHEPERRVSGNPGL